MSFTVNQTIDLSVEEARAAYISTLIDLAREDPSIVALDADLGGSIGTVPFAEAYPERHFNVGIAEANMVSIAAGLAIRGMNPVTHTFTPFAVRRCADQIYLSGAYSRLHMTIVGAAPGIFAAITGGTHMSFEDVGMMISMPEVTIVEPSDEAQIVSLLPQLVKSAGVGYFRLDRGRMKKIYAEGSTFELGKACLVREGKDVTLIASGNLCLGESLRAAGLLQEKGIGARVVDMHTVKPLDEQAVIEAAEQTGAIVTVENTNVKAGMGSLVAQTLCKTRPVPQEFIGAQDRFGEVGIPPYLVKAFRLTAEDIAQAAEKAISRK